MILRNFKKDTVTGICKKLAASPLRKAPVLLQVGATNSRVSLTDRRLLGVGMPFLYEQSTRDHLEDRT